MVEREAEREEGADDAHGGEQPQAEVTVPDDEADEQDGEQPDAEVLPGQRGGLVAADLMGEGQHPGQCGHRVHEPADGGAAVAEQRAPPDAPRQVGGPGQGEPGRPGQEDGRAHHCGSGRPQCVARPGHQDVSAEQGHDDDDQGDADAGGDGRQHQQLGAEEELHECQTRRWPVR